MTDAATTRRTTGERCREWWSEYCDPRSGDAAVRARLRRCRSTAEALTIAPAIGLARRLGATRPEHNGSAVRLERALDLARLLAHISSDAHEALMRIAGYSHFPGDRDTPDESSQPALSEIRFRRLLLAAPGEELLIMIIRVLAQVDGRANIARLAQDVFWWNDNTRERWAFEYYAAGVAAPLQQDLDEETAE